MQTYICGKLAQSDPTFAYVQCVQTPCQKPAVNKVLEVLSICGWEMAEAPSVKTSVLFFGEKEEQ